MNKNSKYQSQFTTEELNFRMDCLKIAAQHHNHDVDICFVAQNLYYWLTTDNDPSEFHQDVEDPNGLLWEAATSRSQRSK